MVPKNQKALVAVHGEASLCEGWRQSSHCSGDVDLKKIENWNRGWKKRGNLINLTMEGSLVLPSGGDRADRADRADRGIWVTKEGKILSG